MGLCEEGNETSGSIIYMMGVGDILTGGATLSFPRARL